MYLPNKVTPDNSRKVTFSKRKRNKCCQNHQGVAHILRLELNSQDGPRYFRGPTGSEKIDILNMCNSMPQEKWLLYVALPINDNMADLETMQE